MQLGPLCLSRLDYYKGGFARFDQDQFLRPPKAKRRSTRLSLASGLARGRTANYSWPLPQSSWRDPPTAQGGRRRRCAPGSVVGPIARSARAGERIELLSVSVTASRGLVRLAAAEQRRTNLGVAPASSPLPGDRSPAGSIFANIWLSADWDVTMTIIQAARQWRQ